MEYEELIHKTKLSNIIMLGIVLGGILSCVI